MNNVTPPRIWINEIEFNDGSTLTLEKNDIVVFVGPNNAGKSVSLKEILRKIEKAGAPTVIVQNIKIDKEGTLEGVRASLALITTKDKRQDGLIRGEGFAVWESAIKDHWENISEGADDLVHIFANNLNTEERLSAANPAPNIKITTDTASHSIHHLYKDDGLELKFSEYFKQAFNTDLTLHRQAGNEIPFYVGTRPVPSKDKDRLSLEYAQALEQNDLLHLQGDGMRSFVGVLLNTVVSMHSVLLIDEPEAFLHPPQASLLGKMLAKDAPTSRQIFLATHSSAFLQGLLNAGTSNLKIVRIERDGKKNKLSSIDSSDIDLIWKDSLLRHSNILDGLFHSQVVICESDADCRFYAAVSSEIMDDFVTDTLFVHSGGKHRIPVVVKALNKLNVPIKIIVDFDFLSEEEPLKQIFIALGGDWTDISNEWSLVKKSIDSKKPELETSELKIAIDSIFVGVSEKNIPKEKVTEIQRILKKASAWAHAKESGKSFVPSGDATRAYTKIVEKLKERGMFLVEGGELESFVKSCGGHGPKWVNEVLTKDLKNDPELEDARKFTREVVEI